MFRRSEGRLLGRGEGAGPGRGRVDILWEPLKIRGSGTRREKAVKGRNRLRRRASEVGRRIRAPRWMLDVMRRYRLNDRQLPGGG